MALNLTNINYSGQDVNDIVRSVYADSYFADTFKPKLVSSIKSSYNFHDLSTNVVMSAFDNCPATFGDITLNQNTVPMCELQIRAEMTHDALIGTYRERMYKEGINSESIMDDAVLFSAIEEVLISEGKSQWDDIIINGDSITPGVGIYALCTGLRKKFTDAVAQVIDVTKVPANLTVAGIIAEMNKIVNAAPAALTITSNLSKRLKIVVSTTIYNLYRQALTQTGNGWGVYNPSADAGMSLSFLGYEVVPSMFLPADEMFATYSDNIHLVYDGMSDIASLQIRDLYQSTHCKTVQAVLSFRGAVAVGRFSDVVWYH